MWRVGFPTPKVSLLYTPTVLVYPIYDSSLQSPVSSPFPVSGLTQARACVSPGELTTKTHLTNCGYQTRKALKQCNIHHLYF